MDGIREFYRYDVITDKEVCRLTYTTGVGTYFSEIPVEGLRFKRGVFMKEVQKLMDEGTPPCEIAIKG